MHCSVTDVPPHVNSLPGQHQLTDYRTFPLPGRRLHPSRLERERSLLAPDEAEALCTGVVS
jgi:hypothetical protein